MPRSQKYQAVNIVMQRTEYDRRKAVILAPDSQSQHPERVLEEAMNLLTIPEFAEQIRVSKSLAYRLISEHKIRHVRIGVDGKGAIRIPEDAISEFLRSCEVQPLLLPPPYGGQ